MTSFHFPPWLKMLLLTLLIQPSLGIIPDDPTAELIGQVCQRTPDTEFCRDVLQQNLRNPSSDIRELVQISVNQVLLNATNTLVAVKRAKANASKEIANLLTICEEGYTIVINEYTEASLALAKNDIDSVLFDEEKTTRMYTDCGDNIDAPLPQFKIYNVQNLALHWVSVAAAVVYKISY